MYTSEDYFSLPEEISRELVDGRLYMKFLPSQVHQNLALKLGVEIARYIEECKSSCEVYIDSFIVNLNADGKHYLKPDVSVIHDKSKLTDYGYQGAPDWVIEIVSPGSIGQDCSRKLFLYRDAGVKEYWIVNPIKDVVLVYNFENESESEIYSFDDKISSGIFNGLNIVVNELIY